MTRNHASPPSVCNTIPEVVAEARSMVSAPTVMAKTGSMRMLSNLEIMAKTGSMVPKPEVMANVGSMVPEPEVIDTTGIMMQCANGYARIYFFIQLIVIVF